MSSSQFAAVGATIVLAAAGGAAVFAFTAAPHSASSTPSLGTRVPVSVPAQPSTSSSPSDASPSNASPSDAKSVYEGAKASVAEIKAVTSEGEATGTGFVVSADGLIVTNGHVVDGAQQVSVQLGTESTTRTAQVVGGDADQDLAVLQVDTGGEQLKPLRLATSGVEVGDTVYAIGSPFGLSQTFTSGIVSAVGRDIQAPDGATIADVIQTDAAINPGNSGGPLLDANGDVVGVNSQIASQGGGNDGIGFSIPAATVKTMLEQAASSSGSSSSSDGTQQQTAPQEQQVEPQQEQVDPLQQEQTDPQQLQVDPQQTDPQDQQADPNPGGVEAPTA